MGFRRIRGRFMLHCRCVNLHYFLVLVLGLD